MEVRAIDFPPLIDQATIAKRIEELASEISSAFGPGPITMLSLLKGAFIFTADLMRALAKHGHTIHIEFITASSYGNNTTSSGEVHLYWQGELPTESDRLLIIDDILDTGLTLSRVKELALRQRPAMCHIAVLLDKPSRRSAPITAEYIGFTIPDHFVIGYGLDFAERYRELPFIAILPTEHRG